MPGKPTGRKDAPKGSMGRKVLLPLPHELDQQSRRASAAEGVTLSEWIRRAMQERLERER